MEWEDSGFGGVGVARFDMEVVPVSNQNRDHTAGASRLDSVLLKG